MTLLHKAAELIICQWSGGAGCTECAGTAAEDQISSAALGWGLGSLCHSRRAVSHTNPLQRLSALSLCSSKCSCHQISMGIEEKSSTPASSSRAAGMALQLRHCEHWTGRKDAQGCSGGAPKPQKPPSPRRSQASLLQVFLTCLGSIDPIRSQEPASQVVGGRKGVFSLPWHEGRRLRWVYLGLSPPCRGIWAESEEPEEANRVNEDFFLVGE